MLTVTPTADGNTHALLETDYPATGVRGSFEALVVPRYLKKVYAAELRLLELRAAKAAGQ